MKLSGLALPPLLAISLVFTEPCDSSHGPGSQPSVSPVEQGIDVSIVYPRFEDLPRHIAATGKFLASDRLPIKAEYRGTIERAFLGEGDRVNAGDPLFTYRSEELLAEIAKKQAEIREAEATLDYDQRALTQPPAPAPTPEARDPALFPDELPPEQPVPPKVQEPVVAPQAVEAERPVADLQAKIRVDEARVELLNKELEQLEIRRQKLTVNAPIQGIIQKRAMTEGSVVEAGDVLFEIVNLNPITLSVNVPQEVSSFIDRTTLVKAAPVDSPQLETDATVFYVSPSMDPVTKMMEVRIHVPNDAFAMKEGQTGKAMILSRRVDKALVLPSKTVVREGDKNYIYVVMGRNAQKTEVQLGQAVGADDLEIIANIRIDDPIVFSGQANLPERAPVNIVKEIPNRPPPPIITPAPGPT